MSQFLQLPMRCYVITNGKGAGSWVSLSNKMCHHYDKYLNGVSCVYWSAKYYESVFWGLQVWGISAYIGASDDGLTQSDNRKKVVKGSYFEWDFLNRQKYSASYRLCCPLVKVKRSPMDPCGICTRQLLCISGCPDNGQPTSPLGVPHTPEI